MISDRYFSFDVVIHYIYTYTSLSCADSHDEAGMICVKDGGGVYKAVLDPQWNSNDCHCDGYVAHCEHSSDEEEYGKQCTSNDTTNNHGGGIGDCHCDGLIPHCENEAYEEAHADHCAQNLGKAGTRIGGGIRMMTDVYIQLHRDQVRSYRTAVFFRSFPSFLSPIVVAVVVVVIHNVSQRIVGSIVRFYKF